MATIEVPHYDELSVRSLWPELNKDADFMRHFPSTYPKGKGPPRDYFFNVLNTLQPEYLAKVMAHANEQRMSSAGEGNKAESIKISEFWEEQLKAMPYLSRKYSFFSCLLSMKSAIRSIICVTSMTFGLEPKLNLPLLGLFDEMLYDCSEVPSDGSLKDYLHKDHLNHRH